MVYEHVPSMNDIINIIKKFLDHSRKSIQWFVKKNIGKGDNVGNAN